MSGKYLECLEIGTFGPRMAKMENSSGIPIGTVLLDGRFEDFV